jgi:hypothetical protein
MKRIEVEVSSLNEALTRMQSLIPRNSELSEYGRLGKSPT